MTEPLELPQMRALRHSRIAIIGNGPGALATLVTFRAEGMPIDAFAVYGDQPMSLHRFSGYTHAIRQERMRSESSGHFFPSDYPGLALLDSVRHRSAMPMLRSLFDIYQPPLEDLLAHARRVAQRAGIAETLVCARIGRIGRDPRAWRPGFVLYDEAERPVGTARHVILALGHAGLRWPEALAPLLSNPRVVHAYQPKEYCTGETVAVLGGGMAAAHEWLAALRAGCHVVAVCRKPALLQPLNAPRCDFTAVGIRRYRRLEAAERHSYLDQLGIGSYPFRSDWEREFSKAEREGRWRRVAAAVLESDACADGINLLLSDGERLLVRQVVCATGFVSDAGAHPLVARLAGEYGARIERGRLRINDDFTIPLAGHRGARVGVVGSMARWALPTADTFAGMKYAARRLVGALDVPRRPVYRMMYSVRMALGNG
jgi:cation diffusion facilitator CzcD-associated flavoprotein CzcO